jgi:hypothetical protein
VDVTQRRLVFTDVPGQPAGHIFKGQGGGPTGCPETSVNTKLCCVTPKKSEDLIYAAAEA